MNLRSSRLPWRQICGVFCWSLSKLNVLLVFCWLLVVDLLVFVEVILQFQSTSTHCGRIICWFVHKRTTLTFTFDCYLLGGRWEYLCSQASFSEITLLWLHNVAHHSALMHLYSLYSSLNYRVRFVALFGSHLQRLLLHVFVKEIPPSSLGVCCGVTWMWLWSSLAHCRFRCFLVRFGLCRAAQENWGDLSQNLSVRLDRMKSYQIHIRDVLRSCERRIQLCKNAISSFRLELEAKPGKKTGTASSEGRLADLKVDGKWKFSASASHFGRVLSERVQIGWSILPRCLLQWWWLVLAAQRPQTSRFGEMPLTWVQMEVVHWNVFSTTPLK